jgi:hypothetical protein
MDRCDAKGPAGIGAAARVPLPDKAASTLAMAADVSFLLFLFLYFHAA